MKQRLGIAAAMLSDPKLLLLDEPANGLDPAGIVAMRETLKGLAAEGKTVFVLEPHPRRGPAARRRPRDHRRGQARARGPDRGPAARARASSAYGSPSPRSPRRRASSTGSPATGRTPTPERDGGWIAIRLDPSRAAEINRALASAGIYASGLETGSDLESLFLELTRSEQPTSHEGTMTGPVGWGQAGAGSPGGTRRRPRRWPGTERRMRLFTAGLRKLVRRPATFVTFGLLIGLLALIYLAVGASVRHQPRCRDARQTLLLLTFPGAYSLVLSFILGLGGLFAMIFGAAIAGSEWTWGTLKTAVARGESRSRYQLVSFASIAFIVGIGLLVAFVIGVIVALIAAVIAGSRRTASATARRWARCPSSSGAAGWHSPRPVPSGSRSPRSRAASSPGSASGSRSTSASSSRRCSCPTSSSSCRSTRRTGSFGPRPSTGGSAQLVSAPRAERRAARRMALVGRGARRDRALHRASRDHAARRRAPRRRRRVGPSPAARRPPRPRTSGPCRRRGRDTP